MTMSKFEYLLGHDPDDGEAEGADMRGLFYDTLRTLYERKIEDLTGRADELYCLNGLYVPASLGVVSLVRWVDSHEALWVAAVELAERDCNEFMAEDAADYALDCWIRASGGEIEMIEHIRRMSS